MPRKPKMLITLALFALVAAGSTPIEAHCADRHTGDHPHCTGGANGSDAIYDVTVTGDLSPSDPGHAPYTGEDGGGRSKPVKVYFQFLDLDLGYFVTEFGPAGAACFGNSPIPGQLTALLIEEERDGSAKVRFWFRGHGYDGTTVIKYQLVMWGSFAGDWRPALDETTSVNLDSWWMTTENKKNRELSCRAAENFPNGVTVGVTRTN